MSLHTRRLSLLLLGTLAAAILVVRAAAQPSSGEQVMFRPFASVAEAPSATQAPATGQGKPGESVSMVPPAAQTIELPSPPAVLFDDGRFTSEQGLTVPTIQALLEQQPGPLKSALISVGDRNQSLAEVVVGQAYLYSLNPKLLLALLEYQSQLLSDPNPSAERLDWAMAFHGEDEKWQGLHAQLRWAARELRRGVRDYPVVTELTYKPDGDEEVKGPLPEGLNAASYAVLRVLAQTRTPEEVAQLLADGSFVATYSKLFEDPRAPLGPLPGPAQPFLRSPLPKPTYVTSFFDHEYPFLVQNGSLVSWWGRRETEVSYDGHDGWDYGLRPPDPILAAAPGTVVWVGNSDDGCATPARGVIIDHGNGYRTLYWHLSEIHVELGQQVSAGDQLGIVGASGCAIGPHLHFQTQYLGRDVDPYGWCSTEPDPWTRYAVGIDSRWLWADRPNPCSLPGDVVAVVPGQAGFSSTGDGWQTAPIGVDNVTLWTPSQPISPTDALSDTITELSDDSATTPTPLPPPKTATWQPTLPGPGRYRVLAYIPYYVNGHDDATTAQYTVHHSGGTSKVLVNQFVYANDWADLGTYDFDPAQPASVELNNATLEADQGVWAGAVVWQKVP